MLRQNQMKPHKVKWTEAERELAVRGVFLPSHAVANEYLLVPEKLNVTQLEEEDDLGEVSPTT